MEGVRSNAEYILSKTISVEAQSLLSWLDAESNRLKEEGNLSAGISDYQEAYKLYTRSLVADPRNLKARNNRSQMLLKLSRFQECLDDTIEVLKAEGSNVKALFRCALAYEGLGRWSDALPQYELILKQEPDHATAQLSKQKLLEKIKAAKAPQKVVASDSEMSPPTLRKNVDEVKTTSTRKIDEAGKDSGNRELKKTKVGSSRARQTSLEAVLKTKEPELPKSPPSTVYELERVWRGCRGHPQLFAKYLAMFQKSTFKKVCF